MLNQSDSKIVFEGVTIRLALVATSAPRDKEFCHTGLKLFLATQANRIMDTGTTTIISTVLSSMVEPASAS
jgi:hypothetical protein